MNFQNEKKHNQKLNLLMNGQIYKINKLVKTNVQQM